MTNVVHEKIVAIVPTAHVELLHRSDVVVPKGFGSEKRPDLIVTCSAEAALNQVEQ
jgi:hypothetical protein